MPDAVPTIDAEIEPAAPETGPGLSVFVSYASHDRPRALAVARSLETAGIQTWVDIDDIGGGQSYGPEIAAGIRTSAALVLLCSAASLLSRNVRQELQLAWRYARPILPLRLEPVEVPESLAYWLEGAQWIDVLDHPPVRWLPRVRQALARLGAALSGIGARAPEEAPPAPTITLPVPPTPLLGREEEMADLRRRLTEGARLLTLTGPGGSGKTRLALELAHAVAGDYDAGAVFVNLAPVRDPALVLPAIAETLGVRDDGGQSLTEALHESLRSRHLLLVLDNVEQVIAAAGEIAELLATAPGLTILATSRAPLLVRAEQEVAVGPLPLPPAGEVVGAVMGVTTSPAVALFLARALAAGAEMELTAERARTVAEIVRRLDGLPLAIELAAARSKLFPPEALLKRLERRLPLLTGGARDLPERQQTLRDTIAWSHDLLDPEAQVLFRRLAVFAGGCSFDAVEIVAAADGEIDLYEGLAALLRQSLLRQERTEGEPRFSMLETIREYALERLEASGEAEAIRRRHAQFFLDMSESAEPALHKVPDPAWLNRLEAEHGNLRAALTWALTADVSVALRISGSLNWFWQVRGYLTEGRSWVGRALATANGAAPAFRAKALWTAGDLAENQRDFEVATVDLTASLELWRELDDRRGAALTLRSLGHVAVGKRDYELAAERYTESLALWRELADKREVATGSASLGTVAYFQGDYERAMELWGEAAAQFRILGDKRRLGVMLNNLGSVAWAHMEFERATELHEESLALVRELGDQVGIASSLTNLGLTALHLGDRERSRDLMEETLELYRSLGIPGAAGTPLHVLAWLARDRGEAALAAELARELLSVTSATEGSLWVGHCVNLVATLAADQGQAERAARLLGATTELREMESVLAEPEGVFIEWAAEAVAARLPAETLAAEMAAGRAMSLDEAITEATALAAELASEPSRQPS